MVKKIESAVQNPYVKQLEGIASVIRKKSYAPRALPDGHLVDNTLTLNTQLMITKGLESARQDGRRVRVQSNI
jgi:hypothetical protein